MTDPTIPEPESTPDEPRTPPQDRVITLPLRAMLTRATLATLGIMLVAGGVSALFGMPAVVGAPMGAMASYVASLGGLLIIGPTKARPVVSWHGLLFAAQAISLPIAVTIALALLYSAAQPTRLAALPTAAVVFITVWIVFAKSYGVAAVSSQSE